MMVFHSQKNGDMSSMIIKNARLRFKQPSTCALEILKALFLGVAVAQLHAADGVLSMINPPIGPYTNPKPDDFADAASFSSTDRVVFTPYFYWYDVYSSAHIVDADGSDALTDHPPTLDDFSYKSPNWHKSQLLDMIDAGIDVVLPVYWGEPSQRRLGQPISAQPWSFSGIPPLVQARDSLIAEGKRPPGIGLFYDTSTLQYNAANRKIDLTTPYGRQWFYETVRDFFSLVPARHWAMIDGRPVIFLYSSAFAANYDQQCIDYLRMAFAKDFSGRTPFIVREISWHVEADDVYAWGGALGLKNPGLASLGPGYDHSAVPGREPLKVDREGGAFFERNWIKFLRRPSLRVMIETWNEYHEGTDIAASREYGRQYIELNRRYVDMFKAGIRPPLPRGFYSDFKSVYVVLKDSNFEYGVTQFDHADGVTKPDVLNGVPCRSIVKTQHPGRYVYFRIDDSFKWSDTMLVDVEVEYFDVGPGTFRIEFDGSDTNAPFEGAYSPSKTIVTLNNTRNWRRATFRLAKAKFQNSQNGGADFRIAVSADAFALRKVTVTRLGMPQEAGAVLRGFQQDFAEAATAWIPLDVSNNEFAQQNNMLVARSAQTGFPKLVVSLPEANPNVSEILARIRIVHVSGAGCLAGGVGFGFSHTGAGGLHLGFEVGTGGERFLTWHGPNLVQGPRSEFSWQTNVWYWVRLRHQTNSITMYPDLFARVWPADGETQEPSAWTVWWDYYPALAHQKGFPGLVAGRGPPATIECDYFLAKEDNSDEITVRFPALKSARPVLSADAYTHSSGFRLRLVGTPLADYLIETTVDFAVWKAFGLFTDELGRAVFTDVTATDSPHRFYRASCLR